MGNILSIIGLILLILLYILTASVILLALLLISKVTFTFRYNEDFELFFKIWFIHLNITKILSRPKKAKTPKVAHFDGGTFGEIPVVSKKTAQKKKAGAHSAAPTNKKQKKGVEETLDLLREIINDCSEPFGKCAVLRIKKLYVTAASDSPDKTAIMFGHLNTLASSIVLAGKKFEKFEVYDGAVGVYSDFCGTKPHLDANIELILKVRHTLSTVIKALKSYIKNK